MSLEDSQSLYVLEGLPFYGSKTVQSLLLDDLENIEPKEWINENPIPEPRSYFSIALVDGKIFVIVGRNSKRKPSNNIYCYNISTKEWKLVLGVQTKFPRSESGCAEINGKIFIVGGFGDASRTLECFNIEQNQIIEKSSLSRGRWGHSVVACHGRIYSLGGQWYKFTESDPKLKRSSTIYLNDVESYDPISDTWKREETMLRRRGYFGAATSGEYIYAVGGMGGEANVKTVQCLDSIERFNTLNGQWSIVEAKLNQPRSNAPVCIYKKILLVIGGNGTNGQADKDNGCRLNQKTNRSILDTIEIIPIVKCHSSNPSDRNKISCLKNERHSFCAVLF